MKARPVLGPMSGKAALKDYRGMEILQIAGAAVIVIGIVVTVLLAIVPSVVDR